MRQSVYIETSLVSYYVSRPSRDLVTASRQQQTRDWWEQNLSLFNPYISILVLEEASAGNTLEAAKRMDALEGMPVLQINEAAKDVAISLVQKGPIPESYSDDALHISLAAVHGIDYILTWNFKHINNARMKAGIESQVTSFGYRCPIICSPEELHGG